MDKSKKNVVVLATCQALMMTCNSLLIAVTPLVGFALASNKTLATLPIALQFLATMLCTLPASLLMKGIGRRAGFVIAALIGAAGAIQCTHAVLARSFVGLCAGVFLIGVFNAFAQYYRFAAADTATPAFRSRAISLVLAGGVVAAFAGPEGWLAGLADGAAGLAVGVVSGLLVGWAVGGRQRLGMILGPALVGLFLGWQAAVVLAALTLAVHWSALALPGSLPAIRRLSPLGSLWLTTLVWTLLWAQLVACLPFLG